MIAGIVFDFILLVILLMIVPLGFLRGGLREICTSAGLLLGMLVSGHWSVRWAQFLDKHLDMNIRTGTFVMSVSIVVVMTCVLGYGGTASFSGKPGPGGRLYGALIALCNGMLLIGFLINSWVAGPHEGRYPKIVEDGHFSKAMSVGFEWILLFVAVVMLLASIFGMFVRERGETVPAAYGPATATPFTPRRPSQDTVTVRPLDEEERQPMSAERGAPVRIKEVRHWEEEAETKPADPNTFGSGWRQTWPGDAAAHANRLSGQGSKDRNRDTIRKWMEDDSST